MNGGCARAAETQPNLGRMDQTEDGARVSAEGLASSGIHWRARAKGFESVPTVGSSKECQRRAFDAKEKGVAWEVRIKDLNFSSRSSLEGSASKSQAIR